MTTESIIDIHAHVFPDAIARKAADSIGSFYGMQANHDGTVGELAARYHEAGYATDAFIRLRLHRSISRPSTASLWKQWKRTRGGLRDTLRYILPRKTYRRLLMKREIWD